MIPIAKYFSKDIVKALSKGFFFFVSLLLLGYIFIALEKEGVLDIGWIESHLKEKGVYGDILFLGIVVFFSSVGFPRQILGALSGFAFGAFEGTIVLTTGLIIGCTLVFFYARFIARSAVKHRFGKQLSKIEKIILSNSFFMVVAIRLFPLGNNTLTSLLAGVSSVSAIPFILGSGVGYLPQNIIFCLLGSGIALNAHVQLVISFLLFVVSSVIGIFLYRRFRSEG